MNTARDGAAATAEAGPQKYLHIELQFNTPADREKKHKFRIVNEHGDEVGDLWGWNADSPLVGLRRQLGEPGRAVPRGQWASRAALHHGRRAGAGGARRAGGPTRAGARLRCPAEKNTSW